LAPAAALRGLLARDVSLALDSLLFGFSATIHSPICCHAQRLPYQLAMQKLFKRSEAPRLVASLLEAGVELCDVLFFAVALP
jgi:hypothetical protein